MRDQLRASCLLLFSLLLLGFSVAGMWLPYFGDLSAAAEFAALACGGFGVYLAFRKET